MADELIDIIDDNSQVIGRMMKSEAHAVGALHRCGIGQVIDSKGNWLFVLQADDRQDAGQLVSPVGGHVQAGEREDDALKREAMEELGIHAEVVEKIGHAIFNREVIGRKENHFVTLFEITSDEMPTLNHESVGMEFFTTEELKREYHKNPHRFGNAFHFVVQHFYPEFL